MIFHITIPNDMDRTAMAADIRHLIEHYGVKAITYRPQKPDRDIGIKAEHTISQKLLGRVIGRIQRRGYEVIIDKKASTQKDNQ